MTADSDDVGPGADRRPETALRDEDRPRDPGPAQPTERRTAMVDGGRAVGIVTLGDLAVERDSSSALADISAETPNR